MNATAEVRPQMRTSLPGILVDREVRRSCKRWRHTAQAEATFTVRAQAHPRRALDRRRMRHVLVTPVWRAHQLLAQPKYADETRGSQRLSRQYLANLTQSLDVRLRSSARTGGADRHVGGSQATPHVDDGAPLIGRPLARVEAAFNPERAGVTAGFLEPGVDFVHGRLPPAFKRP
jgi:hypothetical protein